MIVYRHENNHGKQWAYKLGWILFGWVYDIRYDRCRWFLRLWTLILCTAGLTFGDELLRPSADATSSATSYGCSGTNVAFTSFPNAHDAAGLSTSSSGSVSGGGCRKFTNGECVVPGANQFSARLFNTWPSSGNTWASLTLNINSLSSGGFLSQDSACLAYSLNSGMTWTSIRCAQGGWIQVTNTVSIPVAQDLTKLQVGICVQGTGFPIGGGSSGSDSIQVWDIWTLGTNNVPPTPPAGSGTSRPTDPVIISRWWQQLLESV